MLTVTKKIIKTVLLSTLLVTASNVEARLKYYRYNANIPMVEMSLNMMVAMGVIEQVPGRLVHDGNPYHRMVTASYSPYSRSTYTYPERSRRYNNYRYYDHLDGPISPYDRYDDRYDDRYYGSRYGYSPDYPRYRTWGSQWDSPWANRRGNQWGNQWNGPWGNSWDSPWGNQRSNPWNSTWGSPWGNQWSNPWNSSWGSPWGSSLNNQWMNPWSSQPGYPGGRLYTPGYSTLPLSPDAILGDDWSKNNSYQSDDSSRQQLNNNGYKAEKTSWSGRPSSPSYKRSGYRTGNKKPYGKLNGLWVGENGEMLGIRGNRFLWYDDNNQYAKGQLVKSPTMMKARIEGASTIVRYHYKLQGNELVIMSRDGMMRTFNRMPLMQPRRASAKPHASYSSYKPESDNLHVSYTSYGSAVATPKTLYPHNQSDSVTSVPETGRHTDSVAPRKNFSYSGSGIRNLHVPYALRGSVDNVPAASNSTGNGNARGMRVPETAQDNHAPAATAGYSKDTGNEQQPLTSYSAAPGLLYEQYKPAAGGSNSDSGADSVVQTGAHADIYSDMRNASSASPDMDDPSTYLYSYLKDNDEVHTSVTSSAHPDNSDSSGSSTVAEKNDSPNIWKPNNLFPDRRLDTATWQSSYSEQSSGWARSEQSAKSEVRKSASSEPTSWN